MKRDNFYKQSKLLFLIIFLLFYPSILSSQTEEKYVKVTPGPEYAASWLHELFFGKHWRELWITPVKVKILDLENFAGGLTPIRKGGGKATKSLRFRGGDGREWKFRSVNKNPDKVLPKELRRTFVADLLRDQTSSSNPMAPLIAAPLLEAVNILQAKPMLCYIPDSPKLGEFRNEFANTLGMIEVHPDEAEVKGAPNFEDSDKVKGTFKLFETLAEKRSNIVDSKEFLKARLMDIFMGDWDRHSDQWRWARYKEGEKKVWKPIPRDRDQPFAKFDGLAPSIAAYLIPQITHFRDDYPPIKFASWSGRFLDRRFLTELTKSEWDSITVFVKDHLTDDVIENAVRKLPKEHYELAGEELISKLKVRRDNLEIISNDFYELINCVVDIYCSDDDDYILVNRLNDDKTEVTVWRYDDDNDTKYGAPLYHKEFNNILTKEIRIYMGDADDKILIKGEVNSNPLIRAIGNDGADIFIDSSKVSGYLFSTLPIPSAERKTEFYDDGKKAIFKKGAATLIDRSEVEEPKDELEKYEPPLKNRGFDWFIIPNIDINSDDGLVIGAGPSITKYNFRQNPYEYHLSASGSYATRPSSYLLEFDGTFNSIIKDFQVNVYVFKSTLSLTNYYGYGNDTNFDDEKEDNDYYRVEQEVFTVNPVITKYLTNNLKLNLGFSYDMYENEMNNSILLNDFPFDKYGLGRLKGFRINYSAVYDSRDHKHFPKSGFYGNVYGYNYPIILDIKNDFGKYGVDLRTYLTDSTFTNTTFAFRLAAERAWGKYPFYHSALLGGSENLRGYSRERFSGEAFIFGQIETRIFLTNSNVIIPGKLGMHLFNDAGRVFAKNSSSRKWHHSFGGGIWMTFIDRMFTLSLTIAETKEETSFYLKTRMMF